jgi:hypothetical protein
MKHVMTKFSLALCAVLAAGPAWSQADWGTATPHIDPPVPSRDLRAPDAPMLPFHFAAMPALPPGIETTLVSAPALTPEGHLIMLTRNPAAMLMEFDAGGKFLRTFDPNITIGPHGLKIDRRGNIWVTDSFLNVVWKLDAKGEPLKVFGTRGEVKAWDDSKWNGAFNQPVDVAFDKDDDFYVVQGHGGTSSPLQCALCMTYAKSRTEPPQGSDPRVMKFDKGGNLLASRSLPHANGTYPTIHTVMVTPKGEVWVSDRQQRKIMVLDQSGQRAVRGCQGPDLDVGRDGRHDHEAGQ